jgi:hypothetical protein
MWREAKSSGINHGLPRASLILVGLLVPVVAGVSAIPRTSRAQDDSAVQRLAIATSSLVPYDLDGDTLVGLAELAQLADGLNPEVVSRARFLATAAALDLLVYAELVDDVHVPAIVAASLGIEQASLTEWLQRNLTISSHELNPNDAASYSQILACYQQQDHHTCRSRLRRVADSQNAGATAARLLLLENVVRAVEASRLAPIDGMIAPLLQVAGPLCQGIAPESLPAACRAGGSQLGLAQFVLEQAASDIAALQRAMEGGDPLANHASTMTEDARARIGWNILPEPVNLRWFDDLTLPDSTRPATSIPLELLVVSRTALTVTLNPSRVYGLPEQLRVHGAGEFAPPGRQVLALPGNFRPAITPVGELTEALRDLRSQVDQALAPLGSDAPRWVNSRERPLGLLIDNTVILADLARFVASARRAGYHHFAIIGQRPDGQLVTATATSSASMDIEGVRPQPAVSIGPQDVRISSSRARSVTYPRSELGLIGREIAQHVNEGPLTYSIVARPMMRFGMVYPCIEAVATAVQLQDHPFLLILPP